MLTSYVCVFGLESTRGFAHRHGTTVPPSGQKRNSKHKQPFTLTEEFNVCTEVDRSAASSTVNSTILLLFLSIQKRMLDKQLQVQAEASVRPTHQTQEVSQRRQKQHTLFRLFSTLMFHRCDHTAKDIILCLFLQHQLLTQTKTFPQ